MAARSVVGRAVHHRPSRGPTVVRAPRAFRPNRRCHAVAYRAGIRAANESSGAVRRRRSSRTAERAAPGTDLVRASGERLRTVGDNDGTRWPQRASRRGVKVGIAGPPWPDLPCRPRACARAVADRRGRAQDSLHRRRHGRSRIDRDPLSCLLAHSADGPPLPRRRDDRRPARSSCSTPAARAILIDCGMFQGSPNEAMRNRIPLGYDPKTIDVVLLTHAHLDHCGLIPHLVKEGYAGRVYRDPRDVRAGRARAARLAASSRRSSRSARPAGRSATRTRSPPTTRRSRRPTRRRSTSRPGRSRRPRSTSTSTTPAPPAVHVGARRATPAATSTSAIASEAAPERSAAAPSDCRRRADAPRPAPGGDPASTSRPTSGPSRRTSSSTSTSRSTRPTTRSEALQHFDAIDYGEERRGRAGRPRHVPRRRPHPRLGDHPGPGRGRRRDGRARPARRRSCSPATSAGRTRRSSATRRSRPPPTTSSSSRPTAAASTSPQDEAIRILAETVRMVDDAGGVLLVPSFAIGRTQEVVWRSTGCSRRARSRSCRSTSTRRWRRRRPTSTAATPSPTTRRRGASSSTATRRSTTRTRPRPATSATRRRSPRRQRPYMIVASNGMLTGGRVLGHLRNLIDDPAATLLFVGYQGEGTLGSHLQAGATTVKLDGQVRQVQLPDPLDQRLQRPRRRERAARLAAATSRDGKTAGRRRLPADGLPRPRRPGGPDRDGAEGPGPRLHDEDPALARGRDARVGERGVAALGARAAAPRARRVRWNAGSA